MSHPIFVMTFENGKAATSAAALMPVSVMEAHFAPFVISRHETDLRCVELVLAFASPEAKAGGWGDTGEQVNITYNLKDDDAALATQLVVRGYAAGDALSNALFAILASANAVLVRTGGERSVVGRLETIAHMPADLIASLGTPHIASSGEDLWNGDDVEVPLDVSVGAPVGAPMGAPMGAPQSRQASSKPPAHDPLQMTYWRQLQANHQTLERLFLHLDMQVDSLHDIIQQAARENEPSETLALLREYHGLLTAAKDVAATGTTLTSPISTEFLLQMQSAGGALQAFDLASSIHSGKLISRFSETLRQKAAVITTTLSLLSTVEREAEAAANQALDLARRGLAVQPPAEPIDIAPHELGDAALLAARDKQADNLQWHQRKFWGEIKTMTDCLGGEIKSWTASPPASLPTSQPQIVQLHELLVCLRKKARADKQPDWLAQVSDAFNAAVAFDVVQQVLARREPCRFDPLLSHIGYRLRRWVANQLKDVHRMQRRQDQLVAEIERRGLTP